jgi:hypothetical protein
MDAGFRVEPHAGPAFGASGVAKLFGYHKT